MYYEGSYVRSLQKYSDNKITIYIYIYSFLFWYVLHLISVFFVVVNNDNKQHRDQQVYPPGGSRVADNFTKKPEKKIKYASIIINNILRTISV